MQEKLPLLVDSGRKRETVQNCLRKLSGIGEERLVEIAENTETPLHVRLAAGTLLGCGGDPRISVLAPPMILVASASAGIGTPPDQVADIASRWIHKGVESAWILKEVPRHSVEFKRFAIGRYLVTNQEYLEYILSERVDLLPTSWPHGCFPLGAANHPVYSLSPAEAEGYCLWLRTRTGRHFRLPTEYEWEYVATGGTIRDFPWGQDWCVDHANTAEEGLLEATPIGIFPLGVSPTGAFDMAGNVEEITSSSYSPYPGGELIQDDLFLEIGPKYRIARGGSFARYSDLARCSRRHGVYRGNHYVYGFRLAEDFI